jgi:DNA-binding LytR/AlgR family response regulator
MKPTHTHGLTAPELSAGKHVKAVIAEDEPLLREELREQLRSIWPELVICAEVADGIQALAAFDQYAPEVLFLDMQMPGMSGLEVAQHIAGRAHVIFVTAFDSHAVAAFEQGAIDYVLKPLSTERLTVTVARMKAMLRSAPADLGGMIERLREVVGREPRYLQWITVTVGQELRLVTANEVCYFRSDEKYTAVVTAEAEYLISRPLKALADDLDPQLFWRIHRSVVVNVNAIRSVHRDFRGRLEVRLKQRQETLPVSAANAYLFKHL